MTRKLFGELPWKRMGQRMGLFSTSAFFSGAYFANKIEQDAFPWQFYRQIDRNYRLILQKAPPPHHSFRQRTNDYIEIKILAESIKLKYITMIAVAGFFNELWKYEFAFQLLSQFIYSYMNLVFLSKVDNNQTSIGKKQVFYRSDCQSMARWQTQHHRGVSPVDLRSPGTADAWGLPYVSDVTLREGRATQFIEDDEELTPCTFIAGFTSRLVSLSSCLAGAENFAGFDGAISFIVPDQYICGAQHCCAEEVPLNEFEFMVPAIDRRTILAVAYYQDRKLKEFVVNDGFTGDISKLVIGEEARPFITSLPDTHPKKQALLNCIDPTFEPNAGFFHQLAATRKEHYERTQKKLLESEKKHPILKYFR